ncbi:phosphoprotein [Wenzhou Myotis laniger paramyxovirus 2]|uniref:Phosphoprotein n=1 Tax=Wenzhou Myotis laniger paramyxovirus 2 TaxID=2928980 RepID=A0A8T9KMC2_9MONO|nr:phosphoprotein [Wenzhou Myotis laniger paramyxovirus 2]
MSQNTFKALIESVDNGLQIAQFVQENREAIQKEYGNTAINLSTVKIKEPPETPPPEDQPPVENGSDIRGPVVQGVKEDGGSRHHSGSGRNIGDSSVSDSNLQRPSGDGDYQNRDVEDNHDENKGDRNELEWDLNTDVRGGNIDSQGNDESQGSSPIHIESLLSFEGLDDDDGSDLEQPRPKRAMNIRDADSIDESILDDVFNEGDSVHEKRLKSAAKLQELSTTTNFGLDPIKKGTEEKSQSTSLEERPSLENGVTQSVPRLDLNLSKKNAAAGNVQRGASTASLMTSDSLISPNDELMSKIDTILANQQMIMEKLNTVYEIKEELVGVKKTLNNFGLALSTVESYINSLLIIIPKQGVPDGKQGKEINPDLKLVVGRDQRRGLDDAGVTTKQKVSTKFGEDIFDIDSFNTEMFLEKIDPGKNHAAKFVPEQTPTSIRIIKEIIKQRVKDDTIHRSLYEFIDQSAAKVSAEVIHKEILAMLDSVGL